MKRASGELLSHEEVINKLDNETVAYEAALGVSDQFTEVLRVTFKVQAERYESTVTWLRDVVWGAIFDKERCVVLQRISQFAEPYKDFTSLLRKSRSLFPSSSAMVATSYLLSGLKTTSTGVLLPSQALYCPSQNLFQNS